MIRHLIKSISIIVFILTISVDVLGCDPVPDYFIMGQDTFTYRDFIQIKDFFKPFSGYRNKLIYQGGLNTACRPCINIWKVNNDSLYLNNLAACTRRKYLIDDALFDTLKTKHIPQRAIDKIEVLKGNEFYNYKPFLDKLRKILTRNEINEYSMEIINTSRDMKNKFPPLHPLNFKPYIKSKYLKMNMFCKYFSGTIRVEIGESIDSMFIYWHKPTEKDLILNIDKGMVIDRHIIESIYHHSDSSGLQINLNEYILSIPNLYEKMNSKKPNISKLNKIDKNENDSMTYYNPTTSPLISMALLGEPDIWNRVDLLEKQTKIISNEIERFYEGYSFSEYNYLKIKNV